jgi:hypothetical protein
VGPQKKRGGRGPESLAAEAIAHALVPAFLVDHGFRQVQAGRFKNGLTIRAQDPHGEAYVIRVKTCWYRGDRTLRNPRADTYSGAQLTNIDGIHADRAAAVQTKVAKWQTQGHTHLLLLQCKEGRIQYAALIPMDAIYPIWKRQYDIGAEALASGKVTGRGKNPAENGASPTLWFHIDRCGRDIEDALWLHPGVINLTPSTVTPSTSDTDGEDPTLRTFTEGCPQTRSVIDYARNPQARAACIGYHGLACAVCDMRFGETYGEEYASFIHVHHHRALASRGGSYVVNPVEDLIPVCPNCHAVIHRHDPPLDIEAVRDLFWGPNGS